MKKTSEVESGAGVFAAIVTSLVTKVREKGGDIGADFHRLAKPEGASVLDKITDLIIQAGQAARNSFKVVVDYGLSLADMIAAGKYDFANSDINADNFPIQGSGQQDVVVELVHFGRDIESNDVLRELDTRGLRPAILPELLAFGTAYPEKQREFPIIVLGSVWQDRGGRRDVACLSRRGSERDLGLSWLDDRWGGHCRFAAVRK